MNLGEIEIHDFLTAYMKKYMCMKTGFITYDQRKWEEHLHHCEHYTTDKIICNVCSRPTTTKTRVFTLSETRSISPTCDACKNSNVSNVFK